MSTSIKSGYDFDAKNGEDFDKNTESITQALMKISSDIKLKPTAAELSRLTGLHRNTLRGREWPLKRLESIKEDRAVAEIRKAMSKKKKSDPVSVLTEKLAASRLELIYWFNNAAEKEDSHRLHLQESKLLAESLEFYKRRLAETQQNLTKARKEIERLQDVIDVLETSNRG
ncbi:hypothetical protein ALP33_04395 [Pseudomonas amygdali pv. lachrymans]|jgi:vacuolar-type H+-ATPase subunit I/STV1|uniref:Uncharacterized protein n=1 Tax=Pseudomonas amygdali pv. lachrymans TaxID=53707 RepID=A0AB37R9D3_PSEAV|nr:hypothetical protein [Pseudomonas amygdali]RMU21865.1 hypothetical protein ALP33_04395 [Pseudomonas amygdali pv. lachrymans]